MESVQFKRPTDVLNSVLEKTQLICHEENVDFEHSGNRSMKNKDCGMQTAYQG